MIKTIAIANYRSIRNLAVELHGLDVVTGANGSGKSSLYRALRLLAECAFGYLGDLGMPVSSGTGFDEATGRPRPSAFVDHAFPGSRLEIAVSDGRFSVKLKQPGMLRPMKAAELSDGTLRFLLLTAALLTPRPPELMVLNEPETSLHVDLMPALAGLIVQASANSQMIVVTHSEALLRALRESGAAYEHELYKDLGETRIKGLGSLEGPLWSWPKR